VEIEQAHHRVLSAWHRERHRDCGNYTEEAILAQAYSTHIYPSGTPSSNPGIHGPGEAYPCKRMVTEAH
jgi:hypothetical protein